MIWRILETRYSEVMKVDFIQLATVDSTNTWAKRNAPTFNPFHLTCITSEEQTAGRARQLKKWISPKGANLYMTVYLVIPENASYQSNLGQIMALSAADLLLEMKVPTEIKWPNDLLVHQKKMGGILTETVSCKNSVGMAIGIGLNVNMPEDILKTIDQPATSLHLVLHKTLQPASLVKPLLQLFISHFSTLQTQGFAPFQTRFQKLLAYKGRTITVHMPGKVIEGTCDSITSDGRLKLLLPAGNFISLSVGEII